MFEKLVQDYAKRGIKFKVSSAIGKDGVRYVANICTDPWMMSRLPTVEFAVSAKSLDELAELARDRLGLCEAILKARDLDEEAFRQTRVAAAAESKAAMARDQLVSLVTSGKASAGEARASARRMDLM